MSGIGWRKILKVLVILIVLGALAFVATAFHLHRQIQARLANGWFLPPVELYTSGRTISLGQFVDLQELKDYLSRSNFRERHEGQSLREKDFAMLDASQCQDLSRSTFLDDASECLVFRTAATNFGPQREPTIHLLAVKENGQVARLFQGEEMQEVQRLRLPPRMFAQFYNDEPILRRIVQVGETPLQCLHAVTAIEDSDFLDHSGVSVTGLTRALFRNVLEGRYAQGGSTITQQLVKNYFLTPEKTIRRKLMEMIMAVLLEIEVDKDRILENYLNVVYMGQHGPFQILGFGTASEFYFGKNLGDLDLPECALLAALINSPGRYNPFISAENAKTRRALVLDRMASLNLIGPEEAEAAKNEPLPEKSQRSLTEPAPYFTQAIFKKLNLMGIQRDKGLRVFTSLNERAQEIAQKAVLEHVENLEKSRKPLQELKEQGKNLQASLVSVDVKTGEIIALVGGRRYAKTQYNRVLEAHRQVGSLMKPFVYLAALENPTPNGEQYTPLTLIEDKSFRHDYEGQSWSPRNYSRTFYGTVPLFAALKDSMNAATAMLGINVGLENVVDVARRAGVISPMAPYPSLTLGAFEIYPLEVAEAYLTLARYGHRITPHLIRSIEDLNGHMIFETENEDEGEQAFAPENAGLLVGMLKVAMDYGTGHVSRLLGFQREAAGKTGTTNDSKDTWFAGFTPDILTVTWTGYDDNTETKLSGASGALPLWTEFMKKFTANYGESHFQWPDGLDEKVIPREEYLRLVPYEKNPPDGDVRIVVR